MRSRGRSLPRSVWRFWYSGPPPWWMVSTFSLRSVTAAAMEWWLAWNSSDLGLILLWSIVMFCHPSLGGTGLEGCRSENRYEHIHVRFSPAIHGLRNFRNDTPPAPDRKSTRLNSSHVR